MFGIGGSEIIVILVVALLFLGPDKLPEAAKTISKGIRDLKKQSRALQTQIESDEQIGGAIRDLKSALRGDEHPARPPVRKQPPTLAEASPSPAAGDHDEPPHNGENSGEAVAALDAPAAGEAIGANAPPEEVPVPALTLPAMAGEREPESAPHPTADELGHLVKPAAGTVAKKHG